MANRKVLCALSHGFTPLLCVGETAEQRACGIADEICASNSSGAARRQRSGRRPSDGGLRAGIVIGAGGTPAAPDLPGRSTRFFDRPLCALFGPAGAEIPLLYGGSVNLENCGPLALLPEVDGLFIGRSAWEPAGFYRIIQTVLPIFSLKNGPC